MSSYCGLRFLRSFAFTNICTFTSSSTTTRIHILLLLFSSFTTSMLSFHHITPPLWRQLLHLDFDFWPPSSYLMILNITHHLLQLRQDHVAHLSIPTTLSEQEFHQRSSGITVGHLRGTNFEEGPVRDLIGIAKGRCFQFLEDAIGNFQCSSSFRGIPVRPCARIHDGIIGHHIGFQTLIARVVQFDHFGKQSPGPFGLAVSLTSCPCYGEGGGGGGEAFIQ